MFYFIGRFRVAAFVFGPQGIPRRRVRRLVTSLELLGRAACS